MTFFTGGFPERTLKSLAAQGGRESFSTLCVRAYRHNTMWGHDGGKEEAWVMESDGLTHHSYRRRGRRMKKSTCACIVFLFLLKCCSTIGEQMKCTETSFIILYNHQQTHWCTNTERQMKSNDACVPVPRQRASPRPPWSTSTARACTVCVHGERRYACLRWWAADLADFVDISLARAAPLTFSWCQINLDLAWCHIHLGTRL